VADRESRVVIPRGHQRPAPAWLVIVLPELFQGLVHLPRGDLVQTRVAKRAELGQPAGRAGHGRVAIGIARIGRAGWLDGSSENDDGRVVEGRCEIRLAYGVAKTFPGPNLPYLFKSMVRGQSSS